MEVTRITRKFMFKDNEYEDPNIKMSISQVKEFYSHQFPELVNAVSNETRKGERIVITFEVAVGKKG